MLFVHWKYACRQLIPGITITLVTFFILREKMNPRIKCLYRGPDGVRHDWSDLAAAAAGALWVNTEYRNTVAPLVKNPANAGDARETRSLGQKSPWRRAQQPTAVFLPGESRGQRSLGGHSPWGHKELEMTELTHNKNFNMANWLLLAW